MQRGLLRLSAMTARRGSSKWSMRMRFTRICQSVANCARSSALAVVRILNQMARQYQTAIIVVTHDEKIIPTFRRIGYIRDGRTFEEAGGRALD